MLTIRPEEAADRDAIRSVVAAAFPNDVEARLVDALRDNGRLLLSLVADRDGVVVGHVGISPVTLDGNAAGVGLAPLAVTPGCQRNGIGSALVQELVAQCRAGDRRFIVVLGEPAYYLRFGFTPAAERGLGNEYGAGAEFMVLELRRGGIPPAGGLIRYAPEFATVP
jgi:putative acetyltransferase